ncbi:hypothetical protein CpecF_0578 [Chlamydia pecorum DBDeUG]|nr:hypothetical protein CpecF_0578 [Chlamydia pecorum DBDeUG]
MHQNLEKRKKQYSNKKLLIKTKFQQRINNMFICFVIFFKKTTSFKKRL